MMENGNLARERSGYLERKERFTVSYNRFLLYPGDMGSCIFDN